MILVTGGAGFIGSNVLAALESHGRRDLAVCDRLGTGEHKWRHLAKRGLVDLFPPERLVSWLDASGDRIEAVVHMGAISATTEQDVDLIVANNFNLSVDLWRWSASRQVRFIYASSAATYGDGRSGFDDDLSSSVLARLRPMNPYGWSKLLFDRWVGWQLESRAPTPRQWAGLRFFNVYGPNEAHKGSQRSVVLQLVEQVQSDGMARLFRSYRPDYPDGGQRRDFVWVGDCTEVISWLLDHEEISGLFNLGTGEACTFNDLGQAVFAALNREARIRYIDMPGSLRDRYQYFTRAQMSRLRSAGYDRPFTELREGVRQYVRDYLTAEDPYR